MNQRILVVDDEPLSIEALRHYLSEAGYEVDAAENGLVAYSLLSQDPHRYAAVVLDWMMPEVSGLELVEQLQRTAALARIPVIMLTSIDEKEQIIAAVKAGVFDYLLKPVDKDVLVPMLNQALAHTS